MNKKLIIFGTRPEFIKLLPVISEIKKQSLENDFIFVFTGQQKDLTEDLFSLFDFTPDITFKFKNHNNSLSFSFSHILSHIQEVIDEIQKCEKINMIIGQGDTTSCVCAAMSAFFNNIPFGHIEAGLRTNNFNNPYPEEFFRRIISIASSIHFAPTLKARQNLIAEGINKENIILTGNTIVDSIELIKSKISKSGRNCVVNGLINSQKNILITCHRRENQNGKFHTLVEAIKLLAEENPLLNFIWISHNAPFIKVELTDAVFKDHPNIYISPPINIIDLYALYQNSKIIITDSGGIQEEAPSFNIPVIVIREKTERHESIDLTYSVLSGNEKEGIINAFYHFLHQPVIEMKNPYGNGKAAKRIVDSLAINSDRMINVLNA
jgi:UDP-N-acetylglucosamine 2-epimerase (non-hydrolysing)